MPYALCPMPYAVRVPDLSEKGYISLSPLLKVANVDALRLKNNIVVVVARHPVVTRR